MFEWIEEMQEDRKAYHAARAEYLREKLNESLDKADKVGDMEVQAYRDFEAGVISKEEKDEIIRKCSKDNKEIIKNLEDSRDWKTLRDVGQAAVDARHGKGKSKEEIEKELKKVMEQMTDDISDTLTNALKKAAKITGADLPEDAINSMLKDLVDAADVDFSQYIEDDDEVDEVEASEPVAAPVVSEEPQQPVVAHDPEATKILNEIKKYVGAGTKIKVQKTSYGNLIKTGTYDVYIEDNNGARAYTIDCGSILPGRYSVLANSEDATIAVPMVKKLRQLLMTIFGSVYTIPKDARDRLIDTYYVDSIEHKLDLYPYVDFSYAKNLQSYNLEQRRQLHDRIALALSKSPNKQARFRLVLDSADSFRLISDEGVVSPVAGSLTTNIVIYKKITYKDGNITIEEPAGANGEANPAQAAA